MNNRERAEEKQEHHKIWDRCLKALEYKGRNDHEDGPSIIYEALNQAEKRALKRAAHLAREHKTGTQNFATKAYNLACDGIAQILERESKK